MAQMAAILFGAGFTGLCSIALGRLLLRSAGPKLHRQEEDALSFVCGAACLSFVVFLLGVVHAATPLAFLVLGGSAVGLAVARGVHRPSSERLPPLPRYWKLLLLAVFAIFLFVYLPNALAPEVSPDGSTYHLGLVSRYLREGGIVPVRDNMYAQLSQGVEMLFLFAFAFGKHSAAATTHLLFLVALPVLLLSYARRFGVPAAGAFAAILVFASPVVGTDGVSAYIDVALACTAFSVFYLLQVWRQSGRPDAWRWYAAIGLAAGFCYAAKYTAFVALPYAVAVLLWSRARRPMRAVCIVAACAAVMATPWAIKNWIFVGNPFAPLLNQVFQNAYLHAGFDAEYGRYLRLYELGSYAELPGAVTMSGTGGVAGVAGPVFLLAPIGLAALMWPAGRQLWLAALFFGCVYPLNVGTRFLIPVMPFVALAMGLVFSRIRFTAPTIAAIHAILSFPPLVTVYANPDTWRIREIPWRAALRLEPEENFLDRRMPHYAVARMLDRRVPAGERVFSFGGVAEAYTSREVVTRYQSAFGTLIGAILWTPVLTDTQPTWHLWFRWEERSLRRIRIFQTAAHPTDFWSVGEFRVYRGTEELARRPEWRIRTWPNPWHAQLAFDNSPVTRWNTQQRLFPGMFLEVDFGRDEIVSAARLECSHDQYGIRLKLDGRYPNGHWQALSDGDRDENAPPIPHLRRAATREVKLRGIRYVLIGAEDHEAGDYRDLPDQWGMTQVDEKRGHRLYRID